MIELHDILKNYYKKLCILKIFLNICIAYPFYQFPIDRLPIPNLTLKF